MHYSTIKKLKTKLLPFKVDLPLVFITLIAIFTQGYILLNSYVVTNTGLDFRMFHDALWHLSLIEEIGKSFPPTHPGLAGVPLKNYHYLSDALLFIIHQLTFLPVPIVYFKLAPVIASIGFSLSTYLVSRALIKSKPIAYFATALVLFGNNFAYLIPLAYPGKSWQPNSFMLDQPFDQLTNVHTYFAFALFLVAFYFFIRFSATGKSKYGIYSGLLFGLCFGFKAYAATIGLFGLSAAALYQIIINHKAGIFKFSLLPAVIVFAFLYLTTITTSGTFWSPGFILDKMVEDTSRLDLSEQFTLKEQHYRLTHNNKRIAQLYVYKLIIYTVGNLGVRLIGFIFIITWARRLFKLSPVQVFIASAVPASLFLPTLFHQGYNIIQFGQYALILTSIITFIFIDQLKFRPGQKLFLATTIFLFSLPTSIKSFIDILGQPPSSHLSWQEVDALNYLRYQTPPTAVILTHPETKHHYLIIIPGLASRRAYFSSDTFAALTNTAYKDRDQKIKDFFNPEANLFDQISFLSSADINYIYLDSGYQGSLKGIEAGLPITPVFTNSEVTIYKVD